MFEEYLEEQQPEERRTLQALIDHVTTVVPDATAGRSYGLPAFRYKDKPLLGFAAHRDHLSLYPFSAAVVDHVADDLTGFTVSKGTIRFAPDQPVPEPVVTAMVRARQAEIDG